MVSSGFSKALEDNLTAAMLNSDVELLGQILADDLIFTNHLGHIMSKQDDLDAHRSGFVKIDLIEHSEYREKILGDCAIVSVATRIQGSFGGEQSNVSLRFTRVWQKNDNSEWQVSAAQSTLIQQR